MSSIELICDFCKRRFTRPACWHKKHRKRGGKKIYCSKECFKQSRAKPTINCLKCGNETRNPKFCSISCSVSYHNSKKPKRERTNYCISCNDPVLSRRKYCPKCWKEKILDIPNMTLQELSNSMGSRNSYRSVIGSNAREIANKHNKLDECKACGYTLHVDCCHIKPISDFVRETKISVINDPDNLIGLCKRCHWELDHGILKISDLSRYPESNRL